METNKIKLGTIMKPSFTVAFSALANSDELPIETSFKIFQAAKLIDEHVDTYEKLRDKLINKYGIRDSAGNLQMNEDKTNYLITNHKEFDSEYSKLLELELEFPKIPLSSVKAAKLSAAKLKPLLGTVLSIES